MSSYSHLVHYQFTISHTTRSYIAISSLTAPLVHQVDQLTVDLAGRAHQPPGRLVGEDALRGLPLAQRTGRVRAAWPSSWGSLFACRDNRFTVYGGKTACVLPVKSLTCLFANTLCRSRLREQRTSKLSNRTHSGNVCTGNV